MLNFGHFGSLLCIANQFARAPPAKYTEGQQTTTCQVWQHVVPSANFADWCMSKLFCNRSMQAYTREAQAAYQGFELFKGDVSAAGLVI